MSLEELCVNKEFKKEFITYHKIENLHEEYGILQCCQCSGYNKNCLGYVKK